MTRVVLRSASFVRAAKRLVKKHPEVVSVLPAILAALADDALQPSLRTHKLKGDLTGFWACTAGYDLRLIFEFVQHEGQEAILLQTLGTHDEVY